MVCFDMSAVLQERVACTTHTCMRQPTHSDILYYTILGLLEFYKPMPGGIAAGGLPFEPCVMAAAVQPAMLLTVMAAPLSADEAETKLLCVALKSQASTAAISCMDAVHAAAAGALAAPAGPAAATSAAACCALRNACSKICLRNWSCRHIHNKGRDACTFPTVLNGMQWTIGLSKSDAL